MLTSDDHKHMYVELVRCWSPAHNEKKTHSQEEIKLVQLADQVRGGVAMPNCLLWAWVEQKTVAIQPVS